MKKRRILIISILLHTLLLVTVYVFQGAILPFMRLGGLVPLLLPVASTGVALYEGRDIGGLTGLFAGVLCDISFNEPIGAFTVLLTLTGLCIGALSDAAIVPGFVTYYLSCFAVLIASTFVQMFPLIVLQNIPVQLLMATAIQQNIYSLVLALPIWFFVRALGRRLERLSSPGRTT